jgi:multidrug resistance efflux pump
VHTTRSSPNSAIERILAQLREVPINPDAVRRVAVTGATALIALVLGVALWSHYMRAPWTRDGRVRVEVVNIAAEISGKVLDLPVTDNQYVHKGDVLFNIDPADYRLALAQANALVETRRINREIAKQDFDRRKLLGAQAVSSEEINTSESTAAAAQAAYDQAVAQRDQAQLNLSRTVITSPVDGWVTNLHLRVGDYAASGQIRISVTDSDSFWVVGYFEETKLPYIHVGDSAEIQLMGVGPVVLGHVESFSTGIADDNSGTEAPGLPSVNPVFTWVRLAQRIPVRLRIDYIPDGVRIAAGQTCTIVIGTARKSDSSKAKDESLGTLSVNRPG